MKRTRPHRRILPGAALAAAVALGALGCDESPVRMNLLVYDPSADSYVFDDVELATLDDVEKLEGEATKLRAGAQLTLDYQTGYVSWRDLGHSVAFGAVSQGGVLVPEDYDSLAMASIYYNIELSQLFFESIGLPPGVLGALPTYYWAKVDEVDTEGKKTTLVDNAFYITVTEDDKAFFIVPFDQFQWVPLPLNSGIMTHEYTHAVFDALVLGAGGGAKVTQSAMNFLWGINEGAADYMAVARTGDPDFMEHSIAPALFGTQCNTNGPYVDVVRDASMPMNYTDDMDAAANGEMPGIQFCPYEIGAFLAALLYETASTLDQQQSDIPSEKSRHRVATWLVLGLEDLGRNLPADFQVWDLLNRLVEQADSSGGAEAACSIIQKRYNIHFDRIAGC